MFVVSGASVVALKAMPIASGYIESMQVDALETPASPDFNIGAVRWPVAELSADPGLEPFRAQYRPECDGKRGLEAGWCVTKLLARRVPYGPPKIEFVHPAFVPAEALERHMNEGDRSECLNRSALLGSLLLADGVPARVVQLMPAGREGHTVVEVWEDGLGWAVIDPSLGAAMKDGSGRPVGIGFALRHPGDIHFDEVPGAKPPEHHGTIEMRYGGSAPYFADADVRYPEPWLYLRTGQRQAPWPFRAAWARAGKQGLWDGRAQSAARWGAAVFALGGVAALLVRRKRSAELRAVAADVPVP